MGIKGLNLLKEISSSTILSACTSILAFGLNLYIARLFEIDQYGRYELLISIATVLSLLILYGSDTLLSKLFSNGLTEQQLYNRTITQKLISFFLILTAIIFIKSEIALAFISINISCFNLGWLFEIRRKNSRFALIQFIEKVIHVLIILLLYNFFDLSINLLLISLLCANLLSVGYQHLANKELIKGFNLDWYCKKDLINATLIVIISLFEYFNSGIAKLIISEKLSLEEVAIYSQGIKLLVIITIFQSQIQKIFRPILFELKSRSFKELIKPYIFYSTLPAIFFGYCVYLIFPYYLNLLPQSYTQAIGFSFPLAIFFVIVNIHALFKILYIKFDEIGKELSITLIMGVIKVITILIIPFNKSLTLFYMILVIDTFMIGIKLLFILLIHEKYYHYKSTKQ